MIACASAGTAKLPKNAPKNEFHSIANAPTAAYNVPIPTFANDVKTINRRNGIAVIPANRTAASASTGTARVSSRVHSPYRAHTAAIDASAGANRPARYPIQHPKVIPAIFVNAPPTNPSITPEATDKILDGTGKNTSAANSPATAGEIHQAPRFSVASRAANAVNASSQRK